jgi:chromosome partitioning protein
VARVVAIANQKGGVGKTTTAVNLAASLAAAEQRVLLVDMDAQGNASQGVGCGQGTTTQGTYQVMLRDASIRDVLRHTELSTLDIVPATQDLAAIERELADAEDSPTRLRDALTLVASQYDFVIVDCPPSLGTLTINALVAADVVLVPMQCEYYALEGLSQLVGTIERVKGSFNPTLTIDGVLLTMYDARNNLANEVAAEVRQHFHVYETVVPRNIRLAEAPSHGKPVILYDAASRGAFSYINLAREILDAMPQSVAS